MANGSQERKGRNISEEEFKSFLKDLAEQQSELKVTFDTKSWPSHQWEDIVAVTVSHMYIVVRSYACMTDIPGSKANVLLCYYHSFLMVAKRRRRLLLRLKTATTSKTQNNLKSQLRRKTTPLENIT